MNSYEGMKYVLEYDLSLQLKPVFSLHEDIFYILLFELFFLAFTILLTNTFLILKVKVNKIYYVSREMATIFLNLT